MSEPEAVIESRADAAAAVEAAIVHIYQAAKARMKSYAGRIHDELQPVGYGILRMVLDQEPVRASDVSGALGMDKSAVSRQVAALREMGLVDTQHDPNDGRATLLVSTEMARTKIAEFRNESMQDFARVFADWPSDDIRSFARLLTKFNGSIH